MAQSRATAVSGDSTENNTINFPMSKDKISISDLISQDGITFDVNFDDLDEEPDQLAYDPKEIYEYSKAGAGGLIDEDLYDNGEPFETLATRMTNVLDNGKIKKRILREGSGSVVPDKSIVTIHYNSYLEYNDDPFDSTYIRKRPFTFRLNDGQTFPGVDMAVQSMKLNEKSQFLIDPDLAYGKLGCMTRVPPNSTILFEIEVKNFVDSGACVTYENLTDLEKQDFDEIYKYVLALCSKAKDLFNKKEQHKQAIKEYNLAVGKLEYCKLRNYSEQEKQQQLLLSLYSNLVIAYTKIPEPNNACMNYAKILKMCSGTSLNISTKVYFNHARSLILLGDYDQAEKQLKQAQRLEPQNTDISKEFIKLDTKRKQNYDCEKTMAKGIFNNAIGINAVAKKFQNSVTEHCRELKENAQSTVRYLPEKLSKLEIGFVEKEVVKHGLELKSEKNGGVEKHYIAKPSVAVNNN